MVNVHEAKTHLSRLIDRAANGEEIVIGRAGKPVARLVALEPARPIVFGGLKGRFEFDEAEFNAADEEIERLFYGDLDDDPLVDRPDGAQR
jgi:prevent-host-death family protein